MLKKNKWIHFGEPTSIIEPIIKINGDTLEKEKYFKFLGVMIESNGSHRLHLEKRRSLFMKRIGVIQRLGIRKRDVPIGMKSLLFTSLDSSAIKIACRLNLRS
jgi:hypothetical protein